MQWIPIPIKLTISTSINDLILLILCTIPEHTNEPNIAPNYINPVVSPLNESTLLLAMFSFNA